MAHPRDILLGAQAQTGFLPVCDHYSGVEARMRKSLQLQAEMIEDPRGNELNGIKGTAGHPEEADLEGERQPVQGSPAFSNRSQLALVESCWLFLSRRSGAGSPTGRAGARARSLRRRASPTKSLA